MSKILIVDDNRAITRLLQIVLSTRGYAVVVANEPVVGYSLVEQEHPDLVVLDVCLPGMDGWELCRCIRQHSQTPILMLTVLDQDQEAVRSHAVGADAIIQKPFAINEFLDGVHRLLSPPIRRLDANRRPAQANGQ